MAWRILTALNLISGSPYYEKREISLENYNYEPHMCYIKCLHTHMKAATHTCTHTYSHAHINVMNY